MLGSESIVRHGDTLSLSSDINIDLHRVRRCLTSFSSLPSEEHFADICREFSGPLLPAELYVDEVAAERRHLGNTVSTAVETALTLGLAAPHDALEVLRHCGSVPSSTFAAVADVASERGDTTSATQARRCLLYTSDAADD